MAGSHLYAKMKMQGSMQSKQAAQVVKKALEEDPTVFQYDEVYDDIEKDRVDKKEKMKADRKPKYIAELMKTAERRQRENERRIEKQAQKDIEKEGDKFKDKEAFVTTAYKKKMEELKRAEEEEQRQDALDEMTDVTKQKDLSGFYRHLYRSTIPESNKSTDKKAESPVRKGDSENDAVGKPSTSGRSPSTEEKRRSRRDSDSPYHHHRGGEKDRAVGQRNHHHHRENRDRSRERERSRERDHYSRRDSDRYRERDRPRDKRESRDDRHGKDYHRNKDNRDRSHRHHPYSRRDKDNHDRGRPRSRTPPARKEHSKSSGGRDAPKENLRPSGSSSAKKTEPKTLPKYARLGDHPVWKKRTFGQVLEDARDRFLERKREGLIRAIVYKEK